MKYIVTIFSFLIIVSCKEKSKDLPPAESSIEFPDLKSFSEIHKRNASIVETKANNVLIIDSKKIDAEDLCFYLKPEFLRKKKIVIRNFRRTNYKFYLEIYDKINACYRETLDYLSISKFKLSFESIDSSRQTELKKEYPLMIIETKPERES